MAPLKSSWHDFECSYDGLAWNSENWGRIIMHPKRKCRISPLQARTVTTRYLSWILFSWSWTSFITLSGPWLQLLRACWRLRTNEVEIIFWLTKSKSIFHVFNFRVSFKFLLETSEDYRLLDQEPCTRNKNEFQQH